MQMTISNSMNMAKCSSNGEKTMGKAHSEQFLLFPQCLLKTCTADA